jgi:hypothetical protein
MKNITTLIVMLVLYANESNGQTTLDKSHINKAKVALNEAQNCDAAIAALRMVSDVGKKSADYLLEQAKANDCKSKNAEAILYYNKYLEQNPGNDSVKLRVAVLTDQQSKGGAVRVQEENAKKHYKDAKSGFGRKCVSENDFTSGLGFQQFTGGKNNPYSWAINFVNTREYLFAQNKMMFDLLMDFGFLAKGQKSWFANALGTTPDDITKVRGSIQYDLQLGLHGIVINNQKNALAIGGYVGFNVYLMNDVDAVLAQTSYSNSVMFSPIMGVRSTYYIGQHFCVFAYYNYFMKSSYTNEDTYFKTVTPINGNSLNIGIGMRGFGQP